MYHRNAWYIRMLLRSLKRDCVLSLGGLAGTSHAIVMGRRLLPGIGLRGRVRLEMAGASLYCIYQV